MSRDFAVERFEPEHFELDYFGRHFALDQEVAAGIVNAVWQHNKSGHAGNSSEERFLVDPTGRETCSRAPYVYAMNYKASFEANTDSDQDVNEAFGRAVQRAFDDGELSYRLGAKGTALMIALPTAVTGLGEGLALNGHSPTAELAVGVGTGVFTAAGIIAGGYNACRRAIINPNFRGLNELHLKQAGKVAAELTLPPVVVRQ